MKQTTTTASGKERPLSQCSYCDMSFKKLEHAQRHERTHTLDRPYACATCGKTFARQDTLNRHARLHTRNKDDPAPAKGKRRKTGDKPDSPKRKATKLSSNVMPPSPLSPSLPFSLSLPPDGARVPAYDLTLATSAFAAGSANTLSHDYSYASLVGYGSLGLFIKPPALEDHFAVASDGSDALNSPYSDASSSGSDGPTPMSDYSTPVDPESQYPSPAFSSYSPAALNDMGELDRILANDPLHAGLAEQSRRADSFGLDFSASAIEGHLGSSSSFNALLQATGLDSLPPLHPSTTSFEFDRVGSASATTSSARLPPLASISIPVTSSLTHPAVASALPAAYSAHFPSLSLLHQESHDPTSQRLMELFLKARSELPIPPPLTPSTTTALPAFYIPSNHDTPGTVSSNAAFSWSKPALMGSFVPS